MPAYLWANKDRMNVGECWLVYTNATNHIKPNRDYYTYNAHLLMEHQALVVGRSPTGRLHAQKALHIGLLINHVLI